MALKEDIEDLLGGLSDQQSRNGRNEEKLELKKIIKKRITRT